MTVDVINVKVTRHKGSEDVIYFTIALPDSQLEGINKIKSQMQVHVPEGKGFEYIKRLLGGKFVYEDVEISISKSLG